MKTTPSTGKTRGRPARRVAGPKAMPARRAGTNGQSRYATPRQPKRVAGNVR